MVFTAAVNLSIYGSRYRNRYIKLRDYWSRVAAPVLSLPTRAANDSKFWNNFMDQVIKIAFVLQITWIELQRISIYLRFHVRFGCHQMVCVQFSYKLNLRDSFAAVLNGSVQLEWKATIVGSHGGRSMNDAPVTVTGAADCTLRLELLLPFLYNVDRTMWKIRVTIHSIATCDSHW